MPNWNGIPLDPQGGARIPSDSILRPSTLNKGRESSHDQMSLVPGPRPSNTPATHEALQNCLTVDIRENTDAQVPQPWLEERSLFLSQWKVHAQRPVVDLWPHSPPFLPAHEQGEHTN